MANTTEYNAQTQNRKLSPLKYWTGKSPITKCFFCKLLLVKLGKANNGKMCTQRITLN